MESRNHKVTQKGLDEWKRLQTQINIPLVNKGERAVPMSKIPEIVFPHINFTAFDFVYQDRRGKKVKFQGEFKL